MQYTHLSPVAQGENKWEGQKGQLVDMQSSLHLWENDRKRLCSHLLFVGERRVDKLAVENAGALGVRGQEPDDKGNL